MTVVVLGNVLLDVLLDVLLNVLLDELLDELLDVLLDVANGVNVSKIVEGVIVVAARVVVGTLLS